jgi:hypothetical protein
LEYGILKEELAMQLQSQPKGKQLTWNELLSLSTGTLVRDLEGEVGTMAETTFKGRIVRRIEWDDGCITPLSGKPQLKTGIYII